MLSDLSSIDKLSHAIIGATEGLILGDVKAGALGAVIAESLAETIKPLFDTLEGAADTAKVITAGILGTLGFDVDTAIATATVAVENNFRSILFNGDTFDDWMAEDIQAMSPDEALVYLKEHRELMHSDDKAAVDWVLDNPEEVAFLFLPCGQIVKVGKALLATKAMTKVGQLAMSKLGRATVKIVVEDAPVVGKGLSKEQPWVIREGQEWKAKVFGTGQKTGSEGHAFRSYREAIPSAKMESTESVHLNQGMNRVLGEPGAINPNRRPDVTIVRKDGRIDQVEVKSRTDRRGDLLQRMRETKDRLPEHQRGDIKVVDIIKQSK